MVIVGPAERTLLPLAVRHDCLLISKNSNLGLFRAHYNHYIQHYNAG